MKPVMYSMIYVTVHVSSKENLTYTLTNYQSPRAAKKKTRLHILTSGTSFTQLQFMSSGSGGGGGGLTRLNELTLFENP
jgi:hypothetical protein